MQKEAFMPLYLKYRDRETSPATESLEKTLMRLSQPFTYFYFIQADGEKVGAIRIVDERDACKRKRITSNSLAESLTDFSPHMSRHDSRSKEVLPNLSSFT